MRTAHLVLGFTTLVLGLLPVGAATRYVNLNNPSPASPYTSWADAATSIQEAVDAAAPGDEVLVTNGVYQTGGRVVHGPLTNRLAVTQPVTVRSVNGPAVTVIAGYQVPGTLNGDSAVRCVYLTNNAALIGFTVTNGGTWDISGEPPITWAGGGGVFCQSSSSLVSNCVIVGNAAGQGGGVYGGTVNNCIVKENTADWDGGGASGSTLNNCALTGNQSGFQGGGAVFATLNNCTLTANRPSGADSCTLNNCILFHNTPANHAATFWANTFTNCCTTPQPGEGSGNIATEPQLASASHLSAGSPCRGAGSATFASGVDIDGEPWTTPPAIGCDEFQTPTTPAVLTVAMQISLTNVAVGFPVSFNASIDGRCLASRWDFGDGTIVSNRPFAATHSWSGAGDFPVVLTAYDGLSPSGVSVTGLVHVIEETHYVSLESTNPVAPFTSWATAATNIQDAVDVANLPGALVLVTNGTYQFGGRAIHGTMTNRVVVDRPARVQSVNGPADTIIQGYQPPVTTNGEGAVRCVYLTNEAMLVGFTLTGGATRSDGDGDTEQGGGGVWCESTSAVVSNCVLVGNAAGYVGGGARGGTLTDCVLSGNRAVYGGGAYVSTLSDCLLVNNSAGDQGGAAHVATLTGCTLSTNTAANLGGGASSSTVNHCVLMGNSANSGGGTHDCTVRDSTLAGNLAGDSGGGANIGSLDRCLLSANRAGNAGGGANSATLAYCSLKGNVATNHGGGANSCSVNNSVLTGNSAGLSGGGANAGGLRNCTVTGNTAASAGGVAGATLDNCIVFYNRAGRDENHVGSTLNNCCTAPLPSSGSGNITTEPQLVDSYHISSTSPCRSAGSSTSAAGTDLDGEAWRNPPSIGSDEYYGGSVTGMLSVAIQASHLQVAAGFPVNLSGEITGHASSSHWDFGDGTALTNQLYPSHAWSVSGDYPVVLRAFNDSNPGGVSATVTVRVVSQPVHHVSLDSTNPVEPFSSWATAATNIQDAVDAATVPGTLVLVTNGLYRTGGRVVFGALTNRVAINKPLAVQSVNGPAVTVIQGSPTNGADAVRCVHLGSDATLSGFTLTQGATRTDGDGDREQAGGGVWCESPRAVVTNCVFATNTASHTGGAVIGGTLSRCTFTGNVAGHGGAGFLATFEDCHFSGNVATDSGGAVRSASLQRCVLEGNRAANEGGGAHSSGLINCTLTGNSAANYGGGAMASGLNNCVLSGNSSGAYGGGTEGGTLNNCTLTGNSALYGGGAHGSTLNNCILFFNSAPQEANYSGGTLNYCCTTPLPLTGTGNLSADPQLAGFAHLGSSSPCRAAGSASYASGADVDGEPWANPPSIGCDEYRVGALTGSLDVAIQAAHTNVAAGFPVSFTAQIGGRVGDSRWEFGDGTIVSNQPYASHAWLTPGDYPGVLRAYNESNPGGVTATVLVHVVTQPVHYVQLSGSTPVSPFESWATAADNIQAAVDAASVAGALVLVSNGTYQTGSRVVIEVTNRVAITKPIVVQSVNGPAVTTVSGNGVMRCAYVGSGAVLSGFTLTNGVAGPFETVDASERNGGGARCESLSAVLTNCVLTGSSAGVGSGGGVSSGTLLNCTLAQNSAGYGGGGVSSAILNNCLFTSNSAGANGGAAIGSTLENCTLTGNSAWYGGGVDWCTLNQCLLTGNSGGNGGAANNATLRDCLLTTNSATWWGGGALNGTLVNCTLIGNSANSGGAALDATLRNCLLHANTAGHGGATVGGTLYNCTITGNSAGSGGGADGGTLNNCIVYYNRAPTHSNYTDSCTLNFSSAAPPPTGGAGNLAADPQLASFTRISAASPCRGAGSAAWVSGTDIDGEPWLNPPAIGCDEFYSGGHTGPVTVAFQANYTNVAAGIPVQLTSQIQGEVTASHWEFGDGTMASNAPVVGHTWTTAGDFAVVLRAFNGTLPAGVSATQTVRVLLNPIHYVRQQNPSPSAPYLSWATAATNIQDAVDAAYVGGTVLVSNGVYATGMGAVLAATNRVALTRPMTLESVGGPTVTVINGLNGMRGVWLAQGTSLRGFTVTNCSTSSSGGGVFCEASSVVVSNCVLAGNASGNGGGIYNGTLIDCVLKGNTAPSGGGALVATLYRCVLLNNSAAGYGGGASSCTLNHCVLSGNYAYSPSSGGGGGGAYSSTLNNCLVLSNAAPIWGGGAYASTLNNCTVMYNYGGQRGAGIFEGTANNSILHGNYIYGNAIENFGARYWWQVKLNHCCTTPMPGLGGGNFTNAPLLLNQAAGNFRLQSNSPCINRGNNGYVSANSTDLDGNRRIVSGVVDVGAYEFVPPDLADFFQWLADYDLAVDGSADYTDNDLDLANNWQEWVAGTVPTNALSVLRLLNPSPDVTGVTVRWESVSNRTYFLERALELDGSPTFLTLATNVAGLAGTTSFTDTNAVGAGPYFYRLGVQTGSSQFHLAQSLIPFTWLQQYGLPVNGSADFADDDGDRANTWQEWKARTVPTDLLSVLRMLGAQPQTNGTLVSWQSVSGHSYVLERAPNLSAPFSVIESNIPGQAGTTHLTDTNAIGDGPFLYRVGVK